MFTNSNSDLKLDMGVRLDPLPTTQKSQNSSFILRSCRNLEQNRTFKFVFSLFSYCKKSYLLGNGKHMKMFWLKFDQNHTKN